MKNLPAPSRAASHTRPHTRPGWRAVLLAGLAPWLLVACGNKNIDLVKAEMVPRTNYTYGQLLDNNQSCEDKSWKAFKDDKQREMVNFHCSVVIPEELIQAALDYREKRLQEHKIELVDFFEKRVDSMQKQLVYVHEQCLIDKEGIQKGKANLMGNLANLQSPPLDPGVHGRPIESPFDRQAKVDNYRTRLSNLEAHEAETMERCAAAPERINRVLARMETVKPDYMAALDTYVKETRKKTEAYYRPKHPKEVNLLFAVQGGNVQRASFTLHAKDEEMSLVGEYMVAVFLQPDDTAVPKLIIQNLEMEHHRRVQVAFPFLCNGEYCDPGEDALKKSGS